MNITKLGGITVKKILLSLIVLFATSFLATSANAAGFKDLSPTISSIHEVNYLVNKEVISGYDDGTFKPNNLIQKQHIAKMVTEALNLSTANVQNPGYADVPTGHYYYKYVAAAQNAGIFTEQGNFEPTATVTRAYMAEILQRAYKLQPVPNTQGEVVNPFADVVEGSSQYEAILAVSSNHIATGSQMANNPEVVMFNPNNPLTRLHFSAFLARAMTLQSPKLALTDFTTYKYRMLKHNQGEQALSYFPVWNSRWEVENLNKDMSYTEHVETEDANQYVAEDVIEGVNVAHTRLAIDKPIRVGVIGEDTAEKITVLAVDTSAVVNGKNETNLILIEQRYIATGMTYHYYFKDGIGLLKKELVATNAASDFYDGLILQKELIEMN